MTTRSTATAEHPTPHPFAGCTVTLKHHPDDPDSGPVEYEIEDWYDRVAGQSWMWAQGNPGALKYALRSGLQRTIGGAHVPLMSDDVVYGKIGLFGHLVHVNELEVPA